MRFGHPPPHYSITPFRNWSARQDLHLRSLGSRPSMLLLHHALFAPACGEHTGDFVSWGWRDQHTLNLSPAARFTKIGALDGTCTHTLPADNGLLFYSATSPNCLPAYACRPW